jgi:hypothetical protein
VAELVGPRAHGAIARACHFEGRKTVDVEIATSGDERVRRSVGKGHPAAEQRDSAGCRSALQQGAPQRSVASQVFSGKH